jgi:hypothetical protein
MLDALTAAASIEPAEQGDVCDAKVWGGAGHAAPFADRDQARHGGLDLFEGLCSPAARPCAVLGREAGFLRPELDDGVGGVLVDDAIEFGGALR